MRTWLPLVALVVGLPFVAGRFVTGLAVLAGIQVIVVTGLGLLVGHAGQVSLAQATFYGIGAYTAGLLSARAGVNPWIGIAVAPLLAGAAGYAIGRPILRLRGHHLSLGTLAFGLIFVIVLQEGSGWTGGPSGLMGIPRLSAGAFALDTDRSYYFLVWAVALAVLFLYHKLVRSPWGRALRAIAASEVAAGAMGVDTARRKLEAFVVSAACAGVGGALYAHYMTFISPDQFGFYTSVVFVVMAALGGLHSVWGPPIGVLAITALVELIREALPKVVPGAGSEYEIILFGVLLVIIMTFAPQGLAGLARRLRPARGGVSA